MTILRTLRRMYVLLKKIISATINCSNKTVVFIYTLSRRWRGVNSTSLCFKWNFCLMWLKNILYYWRVSDRNRNGDNYIRTCGARCCTECMAWSGSRSLNLQTSPQLQCWVTTDDTARSAVGLLVSRKNHVETRPASRRADDTICCIATDDAVRSAAQYFALKVSVYIKTMFSCTRY